MAEKTQNGKVDDLGNFSGANNTNAKSFLCFCHFFIAQRSLQAKMEECSSCSSVEVLQSSSSVTSRQPTKCFRKQMDGVFVGCVSVNAEAVVLILFVISCYEKASAAPPPDPKPPPSRESGRKARFELRQATRIARKPTSKLRQVGISSSSRRYVRI